MTQQDGGLSSRAFLRRHPDGPGRTSIYDLIDDRKRSVGAPGVATGIAIVIIALTGLRGSDYPAHVFRGVEWKADPLGTWNFLWYGGHSTFAYSVLAPPLTAAFGAFVLCALSSIIAVVLASDLMRRYVGPLATMAGAGTVALMTIDNVVVGRVPFALGYALMLATLLLWSRGKVTAAVGTALLVGFASPVAAVMLGLVVLPIAIDRITATDSTGTPTTAGPANWSGVLRARLGAARNALCVGIATAVPLAAMWGLALHTGASSGYFPFSAITVVYSLLAATAVLVIARRRAVRIGAAVTLVVTALAAIVPNPLGGNLSRFTPFVIVPFGTALAVDRFATSQKWLDRTARHGTSDSRPDSRTTTARLTITVVTVLWAVAVGFALSFAVDMTARWFHDPSRESSYFDPLLREIAHRQADQPLTRVEIPFTKSHLEAAIVAPTVPFARGWERQIDLERNAVLYEPTLTPDQYRQWIDSMGVGLVAVPNAPLDDGGLPEARLIDEGLDWLTLMWSNGDWRLYAVDDPSPLATGGSVTAIDAQGLTFVAAAAGDVTIRAVYDGRLGISPSGCLRPDKDGHIVAHVDAPGEYRIDEPTLSLFAPDPASCDGTLDDTLDDRLDDRPDPDGG